MQKNIEITTEQLATLLWIKSLDDFEDGVNITLQDKYYNFIENNSVIEGMESAEFDKNKEFLVKQKFLKENNKNIVFTEKGAKLVEIIAKTEIEKGLKPYRLDKKSFPNYANIKKFIDDNSNVLQVALAVASLLITIIR